MVVNFQLIPVECDYTWSVQNHIHDAYKMFLKLIVIKKIKKFLCVVDTFD